MTKTADRLGYNPENYEIVRKVPSKVYESRIQTVPSDKFPLNDIEEAPETDRATDRALLQPSA